MSPAAPAALHHLFSEMEQLFQSETEQRVSAGVQAAERSMAEHLNQGVRRLRQARSFPEMAAVLVDAAAPFAGACAVLQLAEEQLRVERARGTTGDSSGISFAAGEGAAFRNALESREPVIALASAGEVTSAVVELFAAGADEKAYLFPLAGGAQPAGILYAMRKVESAALELLAQMAGAIWETRERAGRREPGPAAELIAISPASAQPSGWEALSAADRRLHLRAQRYARVQAAEIRLYHAEAVKSGRAGNDLYGTLQAAIDQAREYFRREFVDASPSMTDYLHLELLHTLAGDDAARLGPNYPGPLTVHENR